MSRVAGNRGKRTRIQPYSWLGAGAVAVGLGAAMLGGAAVAVADPGADPGRGAAASPSQTDATSAAARGGQSDTGHSDAGHSDAGHSMASATRSKAPTRAGRGPAEPETTPPGAAATTTAPRASVSDAADANADTDASTTTADAAAPAPTAGGRHSAARGGRTAAEPVRTDSALTAAPVAEVDAAAATPDGVEAGAAPAVADTAQPAAVVVPAPAANPAPNMTSWLPVTPIVPGAHVQLALQELAAAQGVIQAQTWGSGNVFAGLAAIAPQVLLAGAALSLNAWQATNPGAQQFLAAVAGIPIVAQVAQLNLIGTMLWPGVADLSLAAADFFLPLAGLLGAPGAVALGQPLIAAAREDGKVYAIVPLSVKLGTQPVADVSINGGARAPLLVDTGASGIVVLPSVVDVTGLTNVGSGDSCFSGGLCYHYETYLSPVDFGGGAVTDTGLVNVVTNNDEYPESVATFEDYFSWGADGIVGVGANTAGPGPAPIANATLPGELSNGVLIWQNLLPFGLGGLMIFGPNALPTRVSLPGAPDAYVKVSVNGGALTNAGSIIDSGGVYGTLPLANAPAGSVAGENLPAGTRIAVYAPDGTTLLYTFTTLSGLSATPVIASGLMNTGNAPYQQNPIYMNYAAPDGIGSTDFSIW